MPAKKRTSSRGETWAVDTVAAGSWVVAQAVGEGDGDPGVLDVNEQRARLLMHQANLAQLTEQERRGELLPADEAVEGWQAAIGRTRSLLLGLPVAATDQIVAIVRRHLSDEVAIRAVRERLADGVHEALTELANTAPDEVEDHDAAA